MDQNELLCLKLEKNAQAGRDGKDGENLRMEREKGT